MIMSNMIIQRYLEDSIRLLSQIIAAGTMTPLRAQMPQIQAQIVHHHIRLELPLPYDTHDTGGPVLMGTGHGMVERYTPTPHYRTLLAQFEAAGITPFYFPGEGKTPPFIRIMVPFNHTSLKPIYEVIRKTSADFASQSMQKRESIIHMLSHTPSHRPMAKLCRELIGTLAPQLLSTQETHDHIVDALERARTQRRTSMDRIDDAFTAAYHGCEDEGRGRWVR